MPRRKSETVLEYRFLSRGFQAHLMTGRKESSKDM